MKLYMHALFLMIITGCGINAEDDIKEDTDFEYIFSTEDNLSEISIKRILKGDSGSYYFVSESYFGIIDDIENEIFRELSLGHTLGINIFMWEFGDSVYIVDENRILTINTSDLSVTTLLTTSDVKQEGSNFSKYGMRWRGIWEVNGIYHLTSTAGHFTGDDLLNLTKVYGESSPPFSRDLSHQTYYQGKLYYCDIAAFDSSVSLEVDENQLDSYENDHEGFYAIDLATTDTSYLREGLGAINPKNGVCILTEGVDGLLHFTTENGLASYDISSESATEITISDKDIRELSVYSQDYFIFTSLDFGTNVDAFRYLNGSYDEVSFGGTSSFDYSINDVLITDKFEIYATQRGIFITTLKN